MKKSIKNICVGALSVLCLIGISGAARFQANAAGEAALPELKNGASIRYNVENSGLRFEGVLSGEYFTDGALNTGLEAGMLLVPENKLDSADVFVYDSTDTDVKAVPAQYFVANGTNYEFKIAVWDIPAANYGTKIMAKAYLKTQSGVTYSTTEVTRSVGETASRLAARDTLGVAILGESEKEVVNGYITATTALSPTAAISGENLVISGADSAVCYIVKTAGEEKTFESNQIPLSELSGEITLIAVGDGVNFKNSEVVTVDTVLPIMGEDYAWDAFVRSNSGVAIAGTESTEHVKEGEKSLRYDGFDGSGTVGNTYYDYNLNSEKLKLLAAAYDAVAFDVYVESDGEVRIYQVYPDSFVTCQANTWTTVTIPSSKLSDNKFVMPKNPAVIYIDNFRGGNAQKEVAFGSMFDLSDKIAAIETLGYTVTLTVEDGNGAAVIEGVTGDSFTAAKEGTYKVALNVSKTGYKPCKFEYQLDVKTIDFYSEDFAWDIVNLKSRGVIAENTDSTYVKEGSKSAKHWITGEAWEGYEIKTEYLTELRKMYDAVAFDVYAENQVALSTVSWTGGMVTCAQGAWTTVVLTVADIDTYNKWEGYGFHVDGNGPFYVDNVRGVNTQSFALGLSTDLTDKVNALTANGYTVKGVKFFKAGSEVTSGVDGYKFTPSEVGEYSAKITVGKTGYNDCDVIVSISVYAGLDFYSEDFAWDIIKLNNVNSVNSSGTDSSYLKEGAKYATYSCKNNGDGYYDTYTINTEYLTEVSKMYDSIVFDVYVEKGGVNISTNGWNTDVVLCEAGKWTTVTVKIANIPANIDKNGVIPVTEEGKYFVIDNVRGVNSEKSATVGSEFSLTEKVNALTTNGYTVKSVKFYTEAGAEVIGANNAFTPSEAGKYVAKITVSKAGYNDYVIEVPVVAAAAE